MKFDFNFTPNFGFRKSRPTTNTRLLFIAIIDAKLRAQNVFPSPDIVDVNVIIGVFLSAEIKNDRLVLIVRNDSAMEDFGCFFTGIVSCSRLLCATEPKIGIEDFCSISSRSTILLFKKSRRIKNTPGKKHARNNAII